MSININFYQLIFKTVQNITYSLIFSGKNFLFPGLLFAISIFLPQLNRKKFFALINVV